MTAATRALVFARRPRAFLRRLPSGRDVLDTGCVQIGLCAPSRPPPIDADHAALQRALLRREPRSERHYALQPPASERRNGRGTAPAAAAIRRTQRRRAARARRLHALLRWVDARWPWWFAAAAAAGALLGLARRHGWL